MTSIQEIKTDFLLATTAFIGIGLPASQTVYRLMDDVAKSCSTSVTHPPLSCTGYTLLTVLQTSAITSLFLITVYKGYKLYSS